MEAKQAEAPPELLNVAKYLRSTSHLKTRQGILNGKRVEYFKGKTAIKALQKDSYKKLKNVPKITNEAEASRVLSDVMTHAFYLRVERSGESGARNRPLSVMSTQQWSDDQYYAWFYEGSQLMNYLGGLGLIGIVFAAVLFPLWPPILRDIVWYISVFILCLFGVFMILAVVRLVLFIITMIIVPPGIWLFPNLFADVGPIESFIPLWGWEPKKKEEEDKGREDRDLRTTVEDGDDEEIYDDEKKDN
ncbi:translocation protein Sec62-domain-containing protein [Gigaspora rosea]|uniref:Translocation protein SEC62 n=1 Tax=Gigaspora rosea TaxID=44941 RepID=A0A397VSV3_9GLOM|nr:translocation protein Sec62-domain-containing protein [Gigaspora rosea]